MSPSTLPEPAFGAFVALDWADRQHHFALEEAASGRRRSGVIEHTPEGVQAWVNKSSNNTASGASSLAPEG